MHRTTRLKVTDINQHFICVLCDGYLVDATTIVECLHSFCRTCIVRFLENSKYCPVCDVQVHKAKPLLSLRSDTTLQDVVYKLIPGLYQNEMQRRREFYGEHPEAAAKCSTEERGEGAEQRCFYSPKENISVTLEYFKGTASSAEPSLEESPDEPGKDMMTRHLNCPAAVTVSHLKKFIKMKFSLPLTYTVKIMYAEHLLNDDYTLMDIAYIYSWRRAGPMKFYYTFSHRKHLAKRQTLLPVASDEQVCDAKHESEVSEPVPVAPVELENHRSEQPSATSIEPEKMDTEEPVGPSANRNLNCSISLPSEEAKPNTLAMPPAPSESSTTDIQRMDVEPEIPKPCSLLMNPVPTPKLLPQSSVRIVTTTQNTVLATPNGIKLKIIHCPEASPKVRSKSRKSRSRYKSAPVQRFPRLAPYPPPHQTASPSACIASPLSQMAMGKLVQTGMANLPPTIMTTLVSTTTNSFCNGNKTTTVLPATPILGQPSHVASCTVSTQQIARHMTTSLNNFAPISNCIPSASLTVSSTSAKLTASAPVSNYMNGLPSTRVITVPNPTSRPAVSNVLSNSSGSGLGLRAIAPQPIVNAVTSTYTVTVPSAVPSATQLSTPMDVRNSPVSIPIQAKPNSPAAVSKEVSVQIPIPSSLPTVTSLVSKSLDSQEKTVPKAPEGASILQNMLTEDQLRSGKKSPKMASVAPDGKSDCSGITATPPQSPVKESAFCGTFSADKKSAAFEMSVKNSISAEFSDNDDLGCQPDLVVDEQKMDSSDNEDDTDAALRKKITAIAEKEDEADATDDTEADSGRASDMSSQARSSCDDDIGSPMNTLPTQETVVSTSSTSSSRLPSFTLAVSSSLPTSATETANRTVKSNNINHVINNLLKNHEKKDSMGALDLSTYNTKKPAEAASRPRPVANPVLDIKHRQQTYLPAPNNKQHTACVPSPKHPTSTPILMQGLTNHHHPLLNSGGKSPRLPAPPFHMAYPSQNRPMSTTGRATSSYTVRSPSVPIAHQTLMSGMLPRIASPAMFPIRTTAPTTTPPRSLPSTNSRVSTPTSTTSQSRGANHLKGLASPPQNPYSKMAIHKPIQTNNSTTGYKKSNSYKNSNCKFKGSNFSVFNPDPNGYQHKLVIRNLDVKPGNQQPQKS